MLKSWRQSQCVSFLRRRRCFTAAAAAAADPAPPPLSLDDLLSLLRICVKTKALQEGMHAHHLLIRQKLEQTLLPANLLLHLYGTCGALNEVYSLYHHMYQLDLFSWRFVIKASSLQGHITESLKLFARMQHQGFLPDRFILTSVFSALTHCSGLHAGICIHAEICASTIEKDAVLSTAIVNMYGNCGQVNLAQSEFAIMSQHDSISTTAMITVYAQHGKGDDALFAFSHMLSESVMPDMFTFVSILDVCDGPISLAKGKRIHTRILYCGLQANVIVGTALVDMYGKCGSLADAQKTFYHMEERNLVTWNALMGAYTRDGRNEDTSQVFEQMLQEGTLPNRVTFVNTCNAHSVVCAEMDGKRMHARIVGNALEEDIVIQTALIDLYGNCGQFSHACAVFQRITKHDDVAFISIVSACASCGALVEGRQLHICIICNVLEANIVLGTALINMYIKGGSIEDAQMIFDRLPERNVMTWNALIAAYCQIGQGKQSLALYDCMLEEKVKPDSTTFTSVLSACSHAGLLKDACRCFLAMKQEFKIVPDLHHYNCMIDLYGRTGKLVEAEELIGSMPMEPSAASWTTFLGACRKEVDVGRAEQAANRLFHMNPEDTVPYVMLANTYAAAGRVDDANRVRARMKGLKVKLEMGK